jgi:hypothetical protein
MLHLVEERTMTKTEKSKSTENSKGSCIVLYGYDEDNKPRAARFDNVTNQELLSKAADAMALTQCKVATATLSEIAKKLPAGRLYSNGRGFVPHVRSNLYESLITELNTNSAHLVQSVRGFPASWDTIDVGHLVIAQEDSDAGWWEAVVLEKHNDMLTLQFRDFPKIPTIVRHRSAVALLNPIVP